MKTFSCHRLPREGKLLYFGGMRYRVVLKKLMDGTFLVRCSSAPFGVAEASGGTRDEALEQIRKEIRYRNEWCPCSGVAEDFVQLDVREEESGWQRIQRRNGP